jgi:hypothetical protein
LYDPVESCKVAKIWWKSKVLGGGGQNQAREESWR